jgi:hypothetical protein
MSAELAAIVLPCSHSLKNMSAVVVLVDMIVIASYKQPKSYY